ncbi:hypothetical protein [Brevibacterium litoralis]|uniref:hypothetical protein n=1 Tax=Brevibacterium litoralis TaxID=3138935 RepID=UPI0032EABE0D
MDEHRSRGAPDPVTSARSIVGRVVAIVVSAVFGLVFLLVVAPMIAVKLDPGEIDHHGYGTIFGTMIGAVAGLGLVIAFPLCFRRESRWWIGLLTMAGVLALILAMWLVPDLGLDPARAV